MIKVVDNKKYKSATKKQKRSLRRIQRQLEKKLKPLEEMNTQRQMFDDWTLWALMKDNKTYLELLLSMPVKFEITDYTKLNLPFGKPSSTHIALLKNIDEYYMNFMNTNYPKCFVSERLV